MERPLPWTCVFRNMFFCPNLCLQSLIFPTENISEKYETQNHLLGLDERKLFPRSSHSALNILLQSAGAVISKQWLINARKDLKTMGFSHGWGADYVFSAWVHDEVQVAVREGIEEDVGNIIRRSAQKAGEDFEFRCRIDADFSVGCSWAATH